VNDLLPIGVAPVEVHPDGYRIPGVDRLITPEAARHAKSQGAIRFSPQWRTLALAFCAARDAATTDRSRLRCATEADGTVMPSAPATGHPVPAGGLAPESLSRVSPDCRHDSGANTIQDGAAT
jgi:hypothetical protein